MAVEFHRANRGPISEKDTCKLTDEPIASQDVHRLTSGWESGKMATTERVGRVALYITENLFSLP